MIYAEVANTIRRPRIDVATVMFNRRFDSAWMGGAAKAPSKSDAPLRVGVPVQCRWHLLAGHLTALCEVTAFVPERSVDMAARSPPGWKIRYALEGIPEGTIARIRVEAAPTGVARFLVPAINPLLRQALIRDLDRLKALMESGAWRKLLR